MTASLSAIYTYPVKSCARLAHTQVEVQRRGLLGDRRWLLVDSRGRFITGREQPCLVRVSVTERPGGITLSAPGQADLEVATPSAAAPTVTVTIWRHTVPAHRAAAQADAWFTELTGVDCRLVYQRDEDLRSIAEERGGAVGDHVSFADGYPLLLIGSASLDELNRRLDTPVGMDRFRSNLVVATHEPFVEDRWQHIAIGDCRFDVAKCCSRCVFTTIDPATGIRDEQGEPLNTLRSFRLDREERGVLFGVNLIPRTTGVLALEQIVEAL